MSLKDRLNVQKTVINQELIQNKIKEKIKENTKIPDVTPLNIEGLGILDSFLADENLNSIYVAGAKNVFIEKKGIVLKSTTTFRDNVQLINLIKKSASEAGVEYDENVPFIKFNYKEGINVTATLPPLSSIPTMLIKSYYDNNATLKVLQENKAISKELAMVFEALLMTKANILVAGAPQSLKTTTLSALSKLVPINSQNILIDFKNEIKIDSNNYVSYDFMSLKNEKLRFEILKSILNSNPDRIVANDCPDRILNEIMRYASFGLGGIIASIDALSIEDAVNNASQIVMKSNSNMSFEAAKQFIFKLFNIVVFTSKDDKGQRKISKISELNPNEMKINDIFCLNENSEHQSVGFVPDFYKLSDNLSINPSIFDENYKHTYYQSAFDSYQSANPISKMRESSTKESFESNSEEIIKKAQERFEELKKNARMAEFQRENQSEENN